MFFLNYPLLICCLFASISLWAFRFVRNQRALLRLPVRCLTAIVFTCATFAAVLVSLTTITSAPLYSPDGKKALRVEYADSGALGGVTFVTLYSNFGFRSHVVFWQEGRTVQPNQLRWINNSEVLIQFHENDSPHSCEQQALVRVPCVGDSSPVANLLGVRCYGSICGFSSQSSKAPRQRPDIY